MSAVPAPHLDRQVSESEKRIAAPGLRPKDAATLIVIDRKGRKPKVLMGRRHDGHKFMPGKYVFPGGRIEPGDRLMPVAGSLDPVVEERLVKRVQRPNLMRARALALAAIRETFEETGLMLGTTDYGAPTTSQGGPWGEFAAAGVFPDLEAMHFVARAITPPGRTKRFDTRFFAADRSDICHEVPGVVGPDSELTELAWVDLPSARKLDLPAITRAILADLEARLDAGFAHRLPVPFYYQRHGRFLREDL